MHTIVTRTATGEDLKILRDETKRTLGPLVSVPFFLAGVTWLFMALTSWVGSWMGQAMSSIGAGLGLGLGAVLSLWIYSPIYRRCRMLCRHGKLDATDRIVEVISVSTKRVFELGPAMGMEQVLCFEIGLNRLLYLGSLLRFLATVRSGIVGPFPSTDFTIARFPRSGVMVSIESRGSRLEPEKMVPSLRWKYAFRDSELFDGQLDDIANILSEEQQRPAASDLTVA